MAFMQTEDRTAGGFTLIEVVIAMAIISIGMLGTSMLTMQVMKSNRASRQMATATILAQDRLEEIRSFGYAGAPDPGDADEDSGYGGIADFPAYRRVVSAAGVGSPPESGMKAVTVTVFWENNARSISLTTIMTE